MRFAFLKQIAEIVDEYRDGDNEPLDGDEVERLTDHLRNKINLYQGNITEAEYDELEAEQALYLLFWSYEDDHENMLRRASKDVIEELEDYWDEVSEESELDKPDFTAIRLITPGKNIFFEYDLLGTWVTVTRIY